MSICIHNRYPLPLMNKTYAKKIKDENTTAPNNIMILVMYTDCQMPREGDHVSYIVNIW